MRSMPAGSWLGVVVRPVGRPGVFARPSWCEREHPPPWMGVRSLLQKASERDKVSILTLSGEDPDPHWGWFRFETRSCRTAMGVRRGRNPRCEPPAWPIAQRVALDKRYSLPDRPMQEAIGAPFEPGLLGLPILSGLASPARRSVLGVPAHTNCDTTSAEAEAAFQVRAEMRGRARSGS